MIKEDKLLRCMSCKKQINSEVDKCPQCGKKDPFMFKKIERKYRILQAIDLFISFVLAAKICQLIGGSLVVMAILLCVLTGIFYKIGEFFLRSYFEHQIYILTKEIEKLYGDSAEAYEWHHILGERLKD